MSDYIKCKEKSDDFREDRTAEQNLWFFVLERWVRDLVSLSRDDKERRNAAREFIHLLDHVKDFIIPASGISDGGAERLLKIMRERAFETFDGEDFDEVLKYPRRHMRYGG